MNMNYDKEFFEDLAITAEKSAKIFVPIVHEKLKPRSVLDVGCGTGSWLKAWSKFNVDIFGIDGDWVSSNILDIPESNFRHVNLEDGFDLHRKFDLVVSLEVAEHIHQKSAKRFIKSLVKHGDVILFSAAIPWQGGTNHFNEQWPDYWIKLFAEKGYLFLDPFRHIVWNMGGIKHHYRQNIILFVKESLIKGNPFFEKEIPFAERSLVSVVHPEKYIKTQDPQYRSLRQELPVFLTLVSNFLRNLIRFR